MTVICGVMFSDHESSVAVTPVVVLVILSVPGAVGDQALQVGERVRVEAVFGTKVPVNGAVPAVIEVCAESSKTVLMKFWPLPPTAENSGIVSSRSVRDQDRGEAGIRRGRDAERDGDVGDLERVVGVDGQRRVERAGAGEVAAGIV